MKGKKNGKKSSPVFDDITSESVADANCFLFSFECFWRLRDSDRKRWLVLQNQIETDPSRKEHVLAYVREKYGN